MSSQCDSNFSATIPPSSDFISVSLNESVIKLEYKPADMSACTLSENYKLVCQCAHRCRLNKQSVSFHRSCRGRVIAYEADSEVNRGSRVSPTGRSSPRSTSLILTGFPARHSGGHVLQSISCCNHVRGLKKLTLLRITSSLASKSWCTNSRSVHEYVTQLFYGI